MTAYLWAAIALGILALISNAFLISTGMTTETTPAERAWQMVVSAGFLIWAIVLLIGGAA